MSTNDGLVHGQWRIAPEGHQQLVIEDDDGLTHDERAARVRALIFALREVAPELVVVPLASLAPAPAG